MLYILYTLFFVISGILFSINTCRDGVFKIPNYPNILYILMMLPSDILVVKTVLFHYIMRH